VSTPEQAVKANKAKSKTAIFFFIYIFLIGANIDSQNLHCLGILRVYVTQYYSLKPFDFLKF